MYQHFLDDEQLNFQINRVSVYGDKCMNFDEVNANLDKIKDTGTWTEVWLRLAKTAEKEKRYNHAVYYYRMAEFYIKDGDPKKLSCYKKFKECFNLAHINEKIERFEIPYENTYLPAMRLKAKNQKGILVIHGGYDSFIEEFYPQLIKYRNDGYTLILFEGPGQGQARKNGLTFIYDWEVPTSAVLDYFNLDHVTLMGISWGGYLAPRAAAFDKRIENVICYDIFYWGLDIILKNLPQKTASKMLKLINHNQRFIINYIIRKKMKKSINLNWKINHGMYITGAHSPYDFIKSIDKHNLANCIDKVTANVLLLAGEDDLYVPISRLEDIKKGLRNAKSVTSRVFTAKEGCAQHCQIGDISFAEEEIDKFLEKHSCSTTD